MQELCIKDGKFRSLIIIASYSCDIHILFLIIAIYFNLCSTWILDGTTTTAKAFWLILMAMGKHLVQAQPLVYALQCLIW